jgi:capsular polysaccharide biosynthesis protein
VLSGPLVIDPVIVASRQLEVETGMPLLGVVPRIR